MSAILLLNASFPDVISAPYRMELKFVLDVSQAGLYLTLMAQITVLRKIAIKKIVFSYQEMEPVLFVRLIITTQMGSVLKVSFLI